MNMMKKMSIVVCCMVGLGLFFESYTMEIEIIDEESEQLLNDKQPIVQVQELFEFSVDQRDKILISELQKSGMVEMSYANLKKLFSGKRDSVQKFILINNYKVSEKVFNAFFDAVMEEDLPPRRFSAHLQEWEESGNKLVAKTARAALRENNLDLALWWLERCCAITGFKPTDEKSWYLFFPYYENALMKWYFDAVKKGELKSIDGMSNKIEDMQKYILGAAMVGNKKVVEALLKNEKLATSTVSLNFEIGDLALNSESYLLLRIFQMAVIGRQLPIARIVMDYVQKSKDKKIKKLLPETFFERSKTYQAIVSCYEKKVAITSNVFVDLKYKNHLLSVAWMKRQLEGREQGTFSLGSFGGCLIS